MSDGWSAKESVIYIKSNPNSSSISKNHVDLPSITVNPSSPLYRLQSRIRIPSQCSHQRSSHVKHSNSCVTRPRGVRSQCVSLWFGRASRACFQAPQNPPPLDCDVPVKQSKPDEHDTLLLHQNCHPTSNRESMTGGFEFLGL